MLAHLFPLRPVEEADRVTYRKHWFVLVRAVLSPLLLSLVILLGWAYLFREGKQGLLLGQGGWLGLALVLLSLAPLAWLLWRYEDWRNDYYVITRDRIIDVVRLPLGFHSQTKEAHLSNVQNVTLRIPSILAASLDFGDIEVETAGREGQLTFQSIHHPRQVLNQVSARVEAYRALRSSQERERREGEMLAWLGALSELSRVSILSNPPTARVGEALEVEWRIASPGTQVETYLLWAPYSRKEVSYQAATPLQRGGAGNYKALIVAPLGDRLYFSAFARIDGEEAWSQEQEVPITDFQVDFPALVNPGATVQVAFRVETPLESAGLEWGTGLKEYPNRIVASREGDSHICRFPAPESREIHFRLWASLEGHTLLSREFTIALGEDS